MGSPSPSSSSYSMDETEWELVDGDEDRTISGVFIPSALFLPFCAGPDDVGSAVPTTYSVVSSSGGLVLSRGPWSSYHVADPFGGGPLHTHLPRPGRAHRSDCPAVIVRLGPASYVAVCAVAGSAEGSVYSFDAFSSSSDRWRTSEERLPVGKIDASSGVAAAGSSYWRTDAANPVVVGYDYSQDRARIFTPPPRTQEVGSDKWQLGSACGRLCCVVLTESEIVAYALDRSDRWSAVGSTGLAGLGSARAVRFESTGMEVLLVMDGKLLVVDLERGMIVRELELEAIAEAAATKMVPCIGKPNAGEEREYVEVNRD